MLVCARRLVCWRCGLTAPSAASMVRICHLGTALQWPHRGCAPNAQRAPATGEFKGPERRVAHNVTDDHTSAGRAAPMRRGTDGFADTRLEGLAWERAA